MSSHTIENILSLEGTSRDATANTTESSSLQQNSVPSPSGGDVKSKADAKSKPNRAVSNHRNKRKRDDGKSILCYQIFLVQRALYD